ncbi:uncharacterized protein CC84DRAFT_1222854 [Paraphaeosphaeria sporulosa]|uniref:DUF7924 domain-containing protein n=1 Tax=Paraphaeosphaeria sporulosa TaxID=1460663 RepID=A0A177BWJ1_9PLEO|nr:uncharacterized protein CC84DRAFT_1222854 [Paraphaeosphaeria sporulosa]OAF99853.1 hypothetical protein CC84DRAFT_1222854 [Paraphaeosphaeria sporulosa]
MPKSMDDNKKLLAYDIHVLQKCPMPRELQDYINNTIRKPRQGSTSPYGKKTVKVAASIRSESEDTHIHKLTPVLMEGLQGELLGGVPCVDYCLKPNLEKKFLPQTLRPSVVELHKPSTQPQHDVCYGYIVRESARKAGVQMAFDEEAEDKLDFEPLTGHLHLPFLTMQWKCPTGAENSYDARLQGGCDGATIVNHLFELYERAGASPTLLQTCHLSIVTDGEQLQFHIHWRESERTKSGEEVLVHHMETVGRGAYSLSDEVDMEEARKPTVPVLDSLPSNTISSRGASRVPNAGARQRQRDMVLIGFLSSTTASS